MPGFYQGSSTSFPAFSIALIILSTIAVIGRLVSRHISAAKFWWDDVLTVIGLLNSYVVHVFAFFDIRIGVGEHTEALALNQRKALLKMIYAKRVHYPFGISSIKLAILLFYMRLFRSRQGFKRTIYVTEALVIILFLAGTFTAVFVCYPIGASFTLDAVYQKQHCSNISASTISFSIINILLDIWILVLPLFFVWMLQLSPRRKAGLSGVFLLGAFTIGASIARTYYVFGVYVSDLNWSTGSLFIWSTIEVSVGVICACLPTLPPVLGVLQRKLSEIATFWSKCISRSKDRDHSCPKALMKRKGGMTPQSNKKKTALQLTLGNASWRSLDYKGFGHDITFEELEISHASR